MFGWLKLNTHEWIWRWLCEVQNCQVKADPELQSAWECFGVLELVSLIANNLYSYKQKVLGLEVNISVRYRVMAMLLDFEEKWKHGFKA